MEVFVPVRQRSEVTIRSDDDTQISKPSRLRQSKSCAQKKMEKHRQRINKIVTCNYQKYLKMKLACYSNFDLTYVEALDGTEKFQKWWDFHLTQPLGLALLAECAEEDSEEMISVAAYDEAVGEEDIHIDIVETVSHDNIMVVDEKEKEDVSQCVVEQSEESHPSDDVVQRSGIRKFVVKRSKPSRPGHSAIVVGRDVIMKKAPTEVQKVQFKTRSCSRYCQVPSLVLQCICDVDRRTAQNVHLYKFLGKCNHLEEIDVPYCRRTPGWTIPAAKVEKWDVKYVNDLPMVRRLGPREMMIGKLAIMLHRQPIENLLVAWILLHNTKDSKSVGGKVHVISNPLKSSVGEFVPPRRYAV